MDRVVLDTNVLVADAYNPGSSSARVVGDCLSGTIEAVVSPALREEYEFILSRAVRGRDWRARLGALLAVAEVVEPAAVPRVVEADASDDILFATALEGGAGVVLTNDEGVLAVGEYRGVRAVRPGEWRVVPRA